MTRLFMVLFHALEKDFFILFWEVKKLMANKEVIATKQAKVEELTKKLQGSVAI